MSHAHRSVPAGSTGPTAAEMAEAEKKAKGQGAESRLAPEIRRETNPDARRELDQAGNSLQRLEHWLKFTAPHSMPADNIAKAESYIQRLTTAINDSKTKPEDKVKLAQSLKKFADCKEFGGPGGTLNQFGKAILKGLGTQDPLLGVFLAILFLFLKRVLESRRLKELENELRGLPPDSSLRTKKEAELGAAKFEIAKEDTARANFEGELVKASGQDPETVKKWAEGSLTAGTESALIETAVREASTKHRELAKAMTEFNEVIGATGPAALVAGTPPAAGSAATAAEAGGNVALKNRLDVLSGGASASAPTIPSSPSVAS
jgi:hypothetical protein